MILIRLMKIDYGFTSIMECTLMLYFNLKGDFNVKIIAFQATDPDLALGKCIERPHLQ